MKKIIIQFFTIFALISCNNHSITSFDQFLLSEKAKINETIKTKDVKNKYDSKLVNRLNELSINSLKSGLKEQENVVFSPISTLLTYLQVAVGSSEGQKMADSIIQGIDYENLLSTLLENFNYFYRPALNEDYLSQFYAYNAYGLRNAEANNQILNELYSKYNVPSYSFDNLNEIQDWLTYYAKEYGKFEFDDKLFSNDNDMIFLC